MSELALKHIAFIKKSREKKLDLACYGLTEIPEEIGELIWLEELNLSNESKDLTGKKWKWYASENKSYRNKIKSLPAFFSQLVNLKRLYLNSNPIPDLSSISNLINLQTLSCANTKINDLSPIANFTNLHFLDCSGTQVNNLEPIQSLTELKTLNCIKCPISDISPLKALIEKGVPVRIMRGGDGILIADCPISIPPIEIVKKGSKAILNYFSEGSKEQFKNSEIKLILVGNSTVGKTSLSQFLRDRTFAQGKATTHGILYQQWIPEGREMQINLWDFGGQEYYHATHRLFLSRNAVYAIVWDSQMDKGGFCETPVHFDNEPEPIILQLEHFPQKWWLQNIRHYTRESNPPVPVLMVQNKCARDGQGEVPNEFGKPPFNLSPEARNNFIDLEATANEQASGASESGEWSIQFKLFEKRLLKALENQMATYEFAIYHRDIRDKVRQLAAEGVNDMPYLDFEKMCRDIETDAKMDLVQIYLRDITGDILYYPNNERLQGLVFLRPSWVCDSIYQILSRQVQAQQGLFGIDWVRKALHCDEPNALDFVALMREFELIFEYPKESADEVQQDEVQQWVAPQYLPEACPEQEELTATKKRMKLVHAFTIWFPDFLPKSHIARFVANWGSQAKDRLFWKNGLLFETKDCTVLVERVKDDKIQVEVQPYHPKQKEVLSDVFQSFLKLEEGQAGFAISVDTEHFVWWRDIQERLKERAQQVKVIMPESEKYIDIQSFTAFQKNIIPTKKVFISYSKSDKNYLTELKRHLAPLKRQALLQTWDDTDLKPGEEWDIAIRRELNTADIVILLVSSDLMATDYIWDVEMKDAMRRHQNGEATVIPVIVRASKWEDTPFGILSALPEKGKPISKWEDRDDGWAQVVSQIKQIIK